MTYRVVWGPEFSNLRPTPADGQLQTRTTAQGEQSHTTPFKTHQSPAAELVRWTAKQEWYEAVFHGLDVRCGDGAARQLDTLSPWRVGNDDSGGNGGKRLAKCLKCPKPWPGDVAYPPW